MRLDLNKDSFLANLSFVISGRFVGFVIGFLTTPVLARIYEPETYGVFSVFNSIVMIVAVLLPLNLPGALLICKKDEVRDLISLAMMASVVNSILVFVGFYIFYEFFNSLFETELFNGFWALVSAAAFLKAVTTIFGNWNLSEKVYKRSTLVGLLQTISTRLSAVVLGLIMVLSSYGLILAEILGKLSNILAQASLFLKGRWSWFVPQKPGSHYWQLLLRYKRYPLVLLPTIWMAHNTSALIIFYIGAVYGIEVVGAYGMAAGLINIPVMMIGYASQSMLLQKMAESREDKSLRKKQLNRYLKAIFAISIAGCFVTYFFGKPIITWFLGDQWHLSAEIVVFIIFLLLFELFHPAFEGVLISEARSAEVFLANLLKLLAVVVAIAHAYLEDHSFMAFIELIILYRVVFALVTLARMSHVSGGLFDLTTASLLISYSVFLLVFIV